MHRTAALSFLCILLALAAWNIRAGEEIIVIEQDYNMTEMGKDGPDAKDIRQRIYISRDWMCIDEFSGKDREKPAEGFMIDFKGKQIIQLNHQAQTKITESFEVRRKRIETSKKNTEDDISAQPPGPQKEKLKKLYRAMLDDKRRFALATDPGEAHSIQGVDCNPVKIIDADSPDYVPFAAQLHPTLELPYDNTEALYLLKLMGKGLAEFIHSNKDNFRYVPMELHMELAAGGHLDTKVVKVGKYDKDAIVKMRGSFGNPFDVPVNYEEKQKARRPEPKPEEIP